MRLLEGKVAIITGASAGIGKAAAKLFAANGASVVLMARRQDTLDLVADTSLSGLRVARELDALITLWKEDYNRQRPHSSLGNITPEEFAMKMALVKQAA